MLPALPPAGPVIASTVRSVFVSYPTLPAFSRTLHIPPVPAFAAPLPPPSPPPHPREFPQHLPAAAGS